MSPTIGRFGATLTRAASRTNFDIIAEHFSLDADVHAVEALEREDGVFERHVARTLSQARDGDLGDGGAGLERGDGVGHTQTEVHVAVNLNRLLEPLHGLLDHLIHGLWTDAAETVGDRVGVHVPFFHHLRRRSSSLSTSVRVESMVKNTV